MAFDHRIGIVQYNTKCKADLIRHHELAIHYSIRNLPAFSPEDMGALEFGVADLELLARAVLFCQLIESAYAAIAHFKVSATPKVASDTISADTPIGDVDPKFMALLVHYNFNQNSIFQVIEAINASAYKAQMDRVTSSLDQLDAALSILNDPGYSSEFSAWFSEHRISITVNMAKVASAPNLVTPLFDIFRWAFNCFARPVDALEDISALEGGIGATMPADYARPSPRPSGGAGASSAR